MKKLLILLSSLVFTAGIASAQIIQGGGTGGGGGGAPAGPAGGDLGSTYPNPTVVSVAHVNTGTLPVANGGTSCGTTATFASLPVTPPNGTICTISDALTCTAGTATTAGGGTTGACTLGYNSTAAQWFPGGGVMSAAAAGVTNVNATSPITSTGGTTPNIGITLPLVGNAVTLSGDAHGASNADQVTVTHLAVALPPAQGGTGSTTVPTSGQLPIGNNINTAYAPITVSGDGTLTSGGALTVTKSNGVAFSALATQALPCTAAQGCTGSTNLPTSGQLAIGNAGGTAYAPMSVSGDATLASTGVLTVTGTSGTAFGPFATQTSPCTVAEGCTGGTTAATSGRVLVGNGTIFAPVAMSGDATIVSSGAITVTKTNGVAFATSATTDTTNASNISSGTLNNARLPSAISVTSLTASSLTPGNCLQASTAGLITDTGAACGAGGGGSGTVQTGLVGQIPVYNANGTTVSPEYPHAANIMAAPYNAACDSTTGTNGTDDSVAFGKAAATGGAFYIPTGTKATPRICKVQVFAPGPASLGISGVVGNGTTATVTADAQFFSLPVGKSVIIAGTSHFNGTFTVASVPSTTTFTFASATNATDTAGGTVSWVGAAQTWDGGDKVATVIALQGQSGGTHTSLDNACFANTSNNNQAVGAEVQLYNILDDKISNLTFRNYGTHTGGAGQACIVGIGAQPNNARHFITNVDVDPNETASANSPLSIYAGGGLDTLVWNGGSIGNFSSANSNSQALFITGSTNNVEIDNWNVFPNADTTTTGGSVHFGRLPQMQFSEPAGGSSSTRVHQIRLTKALNGIEFDGANQAAADNVFAASDIGASKQWVWWHPSISVTRGDVLVSPANTGFNATCNSNIDITSISINTSTMWVNEPIYLPCVSGSGPVGDAHYTFITSIINSGEIHVNNAATSSGAVIGTVAAPNMHVYMATTTGTTSATLPVPTFPTTPGGTVSDGGVTWMEYGEGAMLEDNSTQPVTARDMAPFLSLIGVVGNGATTFEVDGIECSSHNVICVEEKNGLGGVVADADIESVTANQDIAGVLVMGSSTIDTLIGYSHVTLGPARSQAIELDPGTNGFLLTDNQLSGLGTSPLNWIPATAQSGSGDINPTISQVIGINGVPISGSSGANQVLTTNASNNAWIYQTYFPDPGVNNGILQDNSTATGVVANNNPLLLLQDAPMWMHYLGTGAEADPNISTSVTLQGLHYYANFTVQAAGTVGITNTTGTSGSPADKPGGSLIVVSPGTCTIAGTINSSNFINGIGNGGGAGGGGGGGAASGATGQISGWTTTTFAPGGAGGGASTTGSVGGALSASAQNYVAWQGPVDAPFSGSQGGQGGSSGGGGGGGAAGLVLLCKNINYTGHVTLSGANGTAGGSNTGGGGGGGGGVFLEAAQTYVANSGTTSVAGGSGGGVGTGTTAAGGVGGAGWTAAYTL